MATSGNLGFLEDVGDARRHVFFHLELEHQVHALGDEFFGILDGDVGIVAVIEHQQFHAGGGGGGGDALRNGHRKGHLRALGGKAKAQAAGTGDQPVLAVLRLGHIAAMDQRFQDAIDAGLGDLGAAGKRLRG